MSSAARRDVSSSKQSGSLSTVVSSLVRAQYGLASQEAIDDETDLDKHVAELLLQEAKAREERAKKDNSYSAWRFSDDEDGDDANKQAPKTNKRFLKNLIKGVEDFNIPLRRNEDPRLAGLGLANGGQNVRKSKEEMDAIRRREREDRERRTGVRDADRSHNRSRYDDSNEMKGTLRQSAAEDQESRLPLSRLSASNSRSAAPSNYAARMLSIGLSSARASRREDDRRAKDVQDAVDAAKARAAERDRTKDRDSDSELNGKRRERSGYRRDPDDRGRASEGQGSRSPRTTTKPRKTRTDGCEVNYKSQRHFNGSSEDARRLDDSSRQRRRSSTVSSDTASSAAAPQHRKRRQSRSPSSHDSEAEAFIDYTGHGDGTDESKMGKYFTTTYDPALDISFQALEDPSTGLIAEGNFSGWDAMLDVLKKRKEDKVFGVTRAREVERERQLHRLDRKKRREERDARRLARDGKKKRKRRLDVDQSEDSDSSAAVGPRPRIRSPQGTATINIGGFEYGKKGSTRAWDLGKESAHL